MRVVIQRVRSAEVSIENQLVGQIGQGLLILIGIGKSDTTEDGQWLAEKISGLRIFADREGLMNNSVRDVGGEILVVSQFTLFASTQKGTRPSFNHAATPEVAIPLYETFLKQLSVAISRPVASGKFGADMQVTLTNDGPVTIAIDSQRRE